MRKVRQQCPPGHGYQQQRGAHGQRGDAQGASSWQNSLPLAITKQICSFENYHRTIGEFQLKGCKSHEN
jgi:hypothetical protein